MTSYVKQRKQSKGKLRSGRVDRRRLPYLGDLIVSLCLASDDDDLSSLMKVPSAPSDCVMCGARRVAHHEWQRTGLGRQKEKIRMLNRGKCVCHCSEHKPKSRF